MRTDYRAVGFENRKERESISNPVKIEIDSRYF